MYEPQLGALRSIFDPHGNRYDLTYNKRGEGVSLTYPAQYLQRWGYDADGRLAGDTVRNLGSTAFPRLTTATIRSTTYQYDGQGRLTRSADPTGFQDTLTVSYSGLGHLATSKLTQRGVNIFGNTVRHAAAERFSFDALEHRYYGETRDTTTTSGSTTRSYSSHSASFQAGTGRILQDVLPNSMTTYTYDAAGNTEFTSNPGNLFIDGVPAEERASFYGPDGKLRAVDHRGIANSKAVFFWPKRYSFEEYRYDALGRRVWVWSKKTCDEHGLAWWEAAECKTSLIRRTVWDGDQELVEIQMPGGTAENEMAVWENDVAPVALPSLSTAVGSVDRNQYFGRVLYTPGRRIDQPVAITRINYEYQHNDNNSSIAYKVLPPITTMPFWNRNGDAPIGVFTTGARRICNPPTTSPGDCVSVVWPYFWSAFDRNRGAVWDNWHGSILERKRDKTGLEFRRNRYYEPATGRFTQEDPIGLAGGINLYGFANGDPINFDDPFGLTQCPRNAPEAPKSSGSSKLMKKLRGGALGRLFVLIDGAFAALSFIIPPKLNVGADIEPAGRPRVPEVQEPADTRRETRRPGQRPPDGAAGGSPDDPPSRTKTTGSGATVTDNTPNRTTPAGGTPSC